MTALYIGSVVNPVAHLRGLPVAVVNEDQGGMAGAQHLDVGQQVQADLLASPVVSEKLHMELLSLSQAQAAMDRDGLYATVMIPRGFTGSLLNVAGQHVPPAAARTAPRITLLTNQRAGTEGVSLATGILQPALAVASRQIGQHLTPLVPPSARTGATKVLLTDPVTVTTTQYRPVPQNSALGLSAFYIALLTILSGFIGGVIVNSVVDTALGYAINELGPRYRQRPPVSIDRWRTLLIKWAIAFPLTGAMTGAMLLVAAGGLGMDAPYPGLLWVYTWLCALSVAVGMTVLLAVVGTYGQVVALLLFVYAGLASAGGTVPVEGLPGPLRLLSYVEPLRQILSGTRSIMYFGAQGVAGLTRGTVAASSGLVFWLVIGAVIVRWYDRKHFYRIHPDLLAHVSSSIQDYKAGQATPAPAPAVKLARASRPRRRPDGS